jgi:hypothetical protein
MNLNLQLHLNFPPDPVEPTPGSPRSDSTTAAGPDNEPGRHRNHRKPAHHSSGSHANDTTSDHPDNQLRRSGVGVSRTFFFFVTHKEAEYARELIH